MQEKLIDIETQSFAGKIQITRNMLSEKANELNDYLSGGKRKILANFGKKFRLLQIKNKKKNRVT